MLEIYRIEKGAEAWKYKSYDYVRTDAFCVGQGIPIEIEFSDDEKEEELQAVLLVEDHKPVAGCRIAFPDEKTGKIERVCVVREKQKGGYGRILIGEAEKWLKEYGVNHIVISSQDRAAGFYEKLGYKLNPDVSPEVYNRHHEKDKEKEQGQEVILNAALETRAQNSSDEQNFVKAYEPAPGLGFTCVLVEKYL